MSLKLVESWNREMFYISLVGTNWNELDVKLEEDEKPVTICVSVVMELD